MDTGESDINYKKRSYLFFLFAISSFVLNSSFMIPVQAHEY